MKLSMIPVVKGTLGVPAPVPRIVITALAVSRTSDTVVDDTANVIALINASSNTNIERFACRMLNPLSQLALLALDTDCPLRPRPP